MVLAAGCRSPAEDASPAARDCTLGDDFRGKALPTPFDLELCAHGGDLRYPFSGVLEVLKADDLTVANLETTLTRAKEPGHDGAFHFRGKPAYARILAEGSVEVANLANNHTSDFGVRGRADTIEALRAVGGGRRGR
jgi:Bacterial capsule synthesis protein PGA_cap